MNESNRLCLDCGKNTFLSDDDYYMLRNKLWRQLVPREQRHGMLCLACVSRRLGRPLKPEDFSNGSEDLSDPDERPMDWDDYGIIDTLTPAMLAAIDQGLIADVSSSRPRKVAWMIGNFMMRSPAAVPGLYDYFYLVRLEHMLDSGVLVVSKEAEYLFHCEVRLA
jgi:hypothetical protein